MSPKSSQTPSGHRARMREKFLTHGLGAFRDDEIIELLLTFGTPRRDCKKPARELLTRLGSLNRVLEAPLDTLRDIPGVGPSNAVALKLIHQVARKFLETRIQERTFFKDSNDVFDYLRHSMRDLEVEIFKVLYLDARHSVMYTEDLFHGTLSYNVIYLRELLRKCLQYNAAAIVIAHNHPSGDPTPSGEDKNLTRDVVFATSLLEVKLLDHVIVGEDRFYSFADRGLIEIYLREFRRNPAITYFREVSESASEWGQGKKDSEHKKK
ncbi:MAG: DNA repair protein RadC [Candidatus Glassbacteria bacterium]|nr:DNA repair protein RadC [Candidatus Glassbacteria bacterium]